MSLPYLQPYLGLSNGLNTIHAAGAGGWTLEEDFTLCTTNQCDGLWLSSDTSAIRVNTGSNWIDWTVSRGTNDAMTYDLGAGQSDTAWLLRFQIYWTARGNSATNQQWWGISSHDRNSAHNVAQDFLGIMTVRFGIDGCRSQEADNAILPASGDVSYTGGYNTSTNYYHEIIRTSATTFEFSISSTDSYSKNIFDSSSITCVSSITGLRYIKLVNENAGTGSDGTESRTPTVKFANGVTVAP
jgi:hypothetical protein